MQPSGNAGPTLQRQVGVFGAVMMGLGSILGTGVFVSIGIAAGVAGPAVTLAIGAAAVVATCNGLSSAQLAANHPVSGGTYEYGYRWLRPALGFTAGWMFLCAKSASAATAALGFAGYGLNMVGIDPADRLVPVGVAAVVVLTVLVLTGIRLSSAANVAIVSVTLFSLLFFVLAGLPVGLRQGGENLTPLFRPAAGDSSVWPGFLQACALMFVAYTGYGRIATLGEEIRRPRSNIPRAIIATLVVSMALYATVAVVAVAAVGSEAFGAVGHDQAAPLEVVARRFGVPGAGSLLAVGAMTAMLGVLLNLILGLSRVLLAMGRRRDVPSIFARLNASETTPVAAVVAVGVVVAGLVLIGDVKTTWSFSAFTVLIYYALTNLSALRLAESERLYPRFVSYLGLAACLFLAFWVDRPIWLAGLALIAAGLAWHFAARRLARPKR